MSEKEQSEMNPFAHLFTGSGFGAMGPNDVENLQKALSTGWDVGGTSQTGGGAFRLESLDPMLSVLTTREHEFVFIKEIGKGQATSTAYEYAQNTALAPEHGGFLAEGELPQEADDTYARNVALIKYLGTLGQVTMQSQMVKNVIDPVQEVTSRKMIWLMKLLERYSFKGDSKLGLAGAEGYEFDGLEKTIATAHASTGEHIINLWRRALEEEDLRDANQTIVKYHGFGTHVFLPQLIGEDYAKGYIASHRHNPSDHDGAGNLRVGFSIKELTTNAGSLQLRPLYLYGGLTREIPVTSAHSLAPTPTPTVAIAIQATATGVWENSLDIDAVGKSGSVEYKIAVGNRFGESTAVLSAPASQAISYANRVNSVRVTITNPVGGYNNAPSFASLYRRDTDADGNVSDWGCVARVALTSVGAGVASLVYDDDGDRMPGTYSAWVIRNMRDIIEYRELLPMTRIPMPRIALSDRFAVASFTTLVMRDIFKLVEIRGIGRRTI